MDLKAFLVFCIMSTFLLFNILICLIVIIKLQQIIKITEFILINLNQFGSILSVVHKNQFIKMQDKYTTKRKLGKGAYGDVYLIEDDDGNVFALKLISKNMIAQQPHLQQYLDGQIETMKALKSQYIVQLIDVEEDQNNIRLILEYCDGGDLINNQAKLKKTTSILSQVILGLEHLHHQGYLHRDIKPQNVLVKRQNEKQIYKLADFGFSKKKAQTSGTILGTQQFMSPEIFSGNQTDFYGFEVDMWAFGVLMYFMLNMEFPFKVNPHLDPEKKEEQLRKLAKKFSYKKSVQGTKKKKMQNCTDQVEDLFKKMFDLDKDRRISFSEIRKHPIFIKHFPTVSEASKILYSKKFQSKIFKKQSGNLGVPLNLKNSASDDIGRSSLHIKKTLDKQFPKEKEILERKKDQIDFLRQNALQFLDCGQLLKNYEKFMLSYNLLKYYIVLLQNFKKNLNKNELNKQYPGLKWDGFSVTKHFKQLVCQVNNDLSQSEVKFSELYDKCESSFQDISKINNHFKQSFTRDVIEDDFVKPFKDSYRKSTIHVFGILRELLKKKETKKGNKLNYTLAILVISHAFNNIFYDSENTEIIFKEYLEEKKKTVDQVDFSELREWMGKSKETVLNGIARAIIKIYFT